MNSLETISHGSSTESGGDDEAEKFVATTGGEGEVAQPDSVSITDVEPVSREGSPGRVEVWGRELIREDDRRAMQKELVQMRDNKNWMGVATRLAQLRRSGLEVSKQKQEKVFGQLLEQAEAIKERGPRHYARYLAHLKAAGASIPDISIDFKYFESGMGEFHAMQSHNKEGASNYAMHLKYLGIPIDVSNEKTMQLLLGDTKEQLIAAGGSESRIDRERLAKHIGRLKYLTAFDERGNDEPWDWWRENSVLYDRMIQAGLEQNKEKGKWRKYVALLNSSFYASGGREISEESKEHMLSRVELLRRRAQEQGTGWGVFAQQVADLRELSQFENNQNAMRKRVDAIAGEALGDYEGSRVDATDEVLAEWEQEKNEQAVVSTDVVLQERSDAVEIEKLHVDIAEVSKILQEFQETDAKEYLVWDGYEKHVIDDLRENMGIHVENDDRVDGRADAARSLEHFVTRLDLLGRRDDAEKLARMAKFLWSAEERYVNGESLP